MTSKENTKSEELETCETACEVECETVCDEVKPKKEKKKEKKSSKKKSTAKVPSEPKYTLTFLRNCMFRGQFYEEGEKLFNVPESIAKAYSKRSNLRFELEQ